MKPFALNCGPQSVPYKYATNLQRPQNAGNGKKQESHGETCTNASIKKLRESHIGGLQAGFTQYSDLPVCNEKNIRN